LTNKASDATTNIQSGHHVVKKSL